KDAKFEDVKVSPNVMGIIWDKVLVNVGINPLTAITGLRNGQLLDYPETEWILEQAVAEGEKVAEAAGIILNTPNPVRHCKEIAEGTRENISSMLADVSKQRKTEINNINGAIVRIGQEHN